MNAIVKRFGHVSVLSTLLFALSSWATPAAIQSEHYIDLRDHAGQSFLQTMIDQDDGIVVNFDEDYKSEYEFPTWDEVDYAVSNFDDKNGKRVLRSFGYDKKLMKKFTEALLDELGTYTPENVSDQVGKMLSKMKIRGDKYALGQFYGIAGGAGTLIRIDEDNYYYNIGYFAPEVRSGRSYGATPHHNANDASHLMYLGELEKFLKYRNDYRQFYTAILEFLTDTDVSVYQNPTFNEYGEALLTDYITVYTAELRRHLMRKLSPYSAPWGNDMTEATFLSLFNVKSGLMMLEGELTKASIKNHWALSPTGSGRSGFGINRKDRRRLQAMISNYFRYHDDASKREIVKKIDKLVGKRRDGDCYRALMQYFNNEINLLNPFRVESIENEIVTAFADFLMAVYDETDEIVESLSEAH